MIAARRRSATVSDAPNRTSREVNARRTPGPYYGVLAIASRTQQVSDSVTGDAQPRPPARRRSRRRSVAGAPEGAPRDRLRPVAPRLAPRAGGSGTRRP